MSHADHTLTMAEKKKRERGPNFSETEKSLLIDLVALQHDIIEDKRTDSQFMKIKLDAWAQLAIDFNLEMGSDRTAAQLKACYQSLKCMAKKNNAKGGGDACRAGSVDDNSTDLETKLNVLGQSEQSSPKDEVKELRDSVREYREIAGKKVPKFKTSIEIMNEMHLMQVKALQEEHELKMKVLNEQLRAQQTECEIKEVELLMKQKQLELL